jgi:hypothetical protein
MVTAILSDNFLVEIPGKVAGANSGNFKLVPSSISLVSQQEKEKVKKKVNKPWSFNVLSDRDIMWKEIRDDLSHANPIALVSVEHKNGEDRYVAIHQSIINKAVELGMSEVPFTKFVDEPQIVNIGEAQFSMYVGYVKTVRNAPWPAPLHKKAKVTVTKPNV